MQFQADNGPISQWTMDPTEACSKWIGLDCKNGRAVSIGLPTVVNTGNPLSAAIGDLDALTALDLSECLIPGAVPESLSKLSNMEQLCGHPFTHFACDLL